MPRVQYVTSKHILVSATLACLSISGFTPCAAAGSLTAELSSTQGDISEPLVLSITIEGDADDEITLPTVANLAFEQAGTSSSRSYVNGQYSQQKQLQIMVYAQKAGDYIIPSMTLSIDGKKESTLPLKFHIAGNTADQSQDTAKDANNAQNTQRGEKTGGVFIERDCDKTEPYIGEQIMCTIRIFHLGNLTAAQRTSQANASFRRFTVEGEKRYAKIIGSQRYGVIEIQEVLVPTESGKLDAPIFSLDARVIQNTRKQRSLGGMFGQLGSSIFDFSFGEEKEVKVSSQPLVLDVKPVPAQNKPADFSGLVGNYELSANASKERVQVGDTVTITINLHGRGLLDTANNPTLDWSAIGKVYADKPEYKEQINAEHGLNSSRVFKFALVPSKVGSYDLGRVKVPAFDSQSESYVILEADLGPLVVEPGAAEATPLVVGQLAPSAIDKGVVKELSEDLIGLHSSHSDLLSTAKLTPAFAWRLVIAGGMPLSLALVFFGIQEFNRRRRVDVLGERRTKSMSRFREAFKASKAIFEKGGDLEAFSQLEKAFKTMLGDKLGVTGLALTPKELGEQLRIKNIDPELIMRTVTALHDLEALAFSDGSVATAPTSDSSKKLVLQLDALAMELDKACRV